MQNSISISKVFKKFVFHTINFKIIISRTDYPHETELYLFSFFTMIILLSTNRWRHKNLFQFSYFQNVWTNT